MDADMNSDVVNGHDGPLSVIGAVQSYPPFDKASSLYLETSVALEDLSKTTALLESFNGVPRPLTPEMQDVFTKTINKFVHARNLVVSLINMAQLNK